MILFGRKKEYDLLPILDSQSDNNPNEMYEIIALAEKYGFEGNLKRKIIAYLLASDENVFSIANEYQTKENFIANSSLYDIAAVDLNELFSEFNRYPCPIFLDYKPSKAKLSSDNENSRIGKLITDFCKELEQCNDSNEFFGTVCDFYRKNGVGLFGLNKGFALDFDGNIAPVSNFSTYTMKNLYGYDYNKKLLISNTEAFLLGKKANNVLLYGAAGTGKSTMIKAIGNEFYKKSLRIIGVQRHEYTFLPKLISSLKSRNYKFIIFIDDLTFEEFETDYKYLKAVIEGGIAEKSDNILFYATSNKRHLVKETFEEREGHGDIHRAETTAEKVSLSERFGLQIYFESPNIDEYFEIVLFLAKQYGVDCKSEEFKKSARIWAIQNGGFSARTATHFINSLL